MHVLRSFDEFIYGHPLTAGRAMVMLATAIILWLLVGARLWR